MVSTKANYAESNAIAERMRAKHPAPKEMSLKEAHAIANEISPSSTFKMVPVQALLIDPEAQRRLDRKWVRAHIPAFDPEQLGYIVVNKRADGKMYVVDGQHRVELIRSVGWGDQNVHAEYYAGLILRQEAALFLARNDRRALRITDKFRIRILAEDADAIGIAKIVQEQGLIVSAASQDGHITAIAALEAVYRGGGIAGEKEGRRALADSLRVILRAWGNQSAALHGHVIKAIGMVELRYNGALDQHMLAKKLAPFPGGAPGLIGKARSMQELNGKPLHHCAASIIVERYNRGLRTGKIETWGV